MPAGETVTTRSFCRVCTALCGVLIDSAGRQILRVRGDSDHPLTRGYTCPKGRALGAMHHHPQRLESPQLRRHGVLEHRDWDACLDDLGERLRGIIESHGPSAVGIYFGSGVGMDAAGYQMAQALHAALGTPARFSPLTIDGTAKVLVASLVGGFPGLHPRADYERTRLLLYIGINPVVSHGHAMSMPVPPPTTIRAVRDRGEVWVIDPRETETTRFASRHLAPRPGRDYAILAYLVRELLADGVDRTRLARATVDSERVRALVAPYTLQHAARVSGTPAAPLSELLRSVRGAGRVAIETGTGVTMSATANLTQWLAWVLLIITDSMNRPGGMWFHPGFIQPLDTAPLPVLPPEALFAGGPPSRPELSGFIGEWPCAALADEIDAGNIRAFLNLGGNLVTAFPDENRLRPALQKLDVLATLDIIENETTALSTHILPTRDQLERPDVTLWDFLSSRVAAQHTGAVVEPVGERRSTWWILAELMRRLGHEPPGTLPDSDRSEAADDAMVAAFAANARCSYADLADTGYVEVDNPLPAPWLDRHIEALGGWHLAPAILVDQWEQLHRSAGAAAAAPGALLLVPRRQKRHVNAQFLYLGDSAEILLHPDDAAASGVADGQGVSVRSDRGEIVGVARVSAQIRPGTVSVPHGHETANVNLLTDGRAVDPITGMARYSGLPVTVSPA